MTKPTIKNDALLEERLAFGMQLPKHLSKANERHRIENILTNAAFVQEKIKRVGPYDVVKDYDYIIQCPLEPSEIRKCKLENLSFIQSAIRLSADRLNADPSQFASHIIGRLLPKPNTATAEFIRKIVKHQNASWLRPLKGSLRNINSSIRFQFIGHEEKINNLAISPKGSYLASASVMDCQGNSKSTIKIWDANTGQFIRNINISSGSVSHLVFTVDEKYLVSSYNDATLRIWDINSGEGTSIIRNDNAHISAINITPDGKYIVSILSDGCIQTWKIDSLKETSNDKLYESPFMSAVIDSVNSFLIIRRDDAFVIYDLRNHGKINCVPIHPDKVHPILGLDTEGQFLASGYLDKHIELWDIKSGQIIRTFNTESHPSQIVLSSAIDRLFVATTGGTITSFSISNGNSTSMVERHLDGATSLVLSPDKRLIVSGSSRGEIIIWNVRGSNGGADNRLHKASIKTIAGDCKGKTILTGSNDFTLKILDLETMECIGSLPGHNNSIISVAVAPDGLTAASTGNDHILRIWDLQKRKEKHAIEIENTSSCSLTILTEELAVSGSNCGNLDFWNLKEGCYLGCAEGNEGSISSLAYIENNKTVVTGSLNKLLSVWNLETHKIVNTLRGHKSLISSMAASRDGKYLISGDWSGVIIVWDLLNYIKLFSLDMHNSILSIVMMPLSHRFISTAGDRYLKIWDIASKKCLASFLGEYRFDSCYVSPDENIILAGDSSGRLHFLHLELC